MFVYYQPAGETYLFCWPTAYRHMDLTAFQGEYIDVEKEKTCASLTNGLDRPTADSFFFFFVSL